MRPEHKTVANSDSKFTPELWPYIGIQTTGMHFKQFWLKIPKIFNLTDSCEYDSALLNAIELSINLMFQTWAISTLDSRQTHLANPAIINFYNFDCFDSVGAALLRNSSIKSHATFPKTEYGVNLEVF